VLASTPLSGVGKPLAGYLACGHWPEPNLVVCLLATCSRSLKRLERRTQDSSLDRAASHAAVSIKCNVNLEIVGCCLAVCLTDLLLRTIVRQ
jgi:hypothetical protein